MKLGSFKEQPGDDTGMQTRVWGPAGWVFLHSIVQNYPWKPTMSKKKEYFQFLKGIGAVLPCRYCRESYQRFIKEPGTTSVPSTRLSLSVLKDRESLVKWLYLVHNKVNEKLGIKKVPTLNQVWNQYEGYRSKCLKSPEKKEIVKKGCTDPLKGYRKKCKIEFVNVNAEGREYPKRTSFGN